MTEQQQQNHVKSIINVMPNYFLFPGLTRISKERAILLDVCETFNITEDALMTHTRKQIVLLPRHAYIYLLKIHIPKITLQKIANIFGYGHCNIKYVLGNVNNTLETDKEYRDKLQPLINKSYDTLLIK